MSSWLPDNALDSSSCSSSSSSDLHQKNCENPRRIDVWTAIMSLKKQDDSVNLPPPYVHPLLRKSSSSLSEKSLKVCTESLGSETGSDVFSSNQSCNKNDDHLETKDKHEHKGVRQLIACLTTKRSQQTRSFPPPVSSLATARTNGSSVHMHARRVDGRLVLEAVSVAPQTYFEAQRQDGRFRLTLINDANQQPSEHVVNVSDENKIKTVSSDKNNEILNERQLNSSSTSLINVQKHSMITVKRINPKEGKLDPSRRLATGLPPLRASVNSYEYFWRAKPTVASVIDPVMSQQRPPTKTKDRVLVRGNKGCKEPRRSHLMWEPFCIATS